MKMPKNTTKDARLYWLIKSEPHTFSFEDLKSLPKKISTWDGVRNYQARNFMRDHMRKGDLALFYYSSCPKPGVIGVVRITKESYPDPTSWDPKSPYFDPKSAPSSPRWFMVDIQWKEGFPKYVALEAIKKNNKLSGIKLVQKGNRLSIMPIEKEAFAEICRMGGL